ncbi:MAG: hypothetical protein JW929_05470 [Anaerolineales bacterium]|nr:hypothetical protein [Anaerolineales bacterium]
MKLATKPSVRILPHTAALAALLAGAFACSLFGGEAAGGALEPAFIYRFGGDHLDDLADLSPDGAGGAYLLSGTLTAGTLVRIDASGKELWRAEVAFGAHAMAVTGEGVYVAGDKRDTQQKVQRSHIAFVSAAGTLQWTSDSPPPPAAAADGRDSVWDLSSPGDSKLWGMCALPDGDAVAVGVEGESSVRHLRVDPQGNVVWETSIPASFNWMYTGGTSGKVKPYLAAFEGAVISVGAWHAGAGGADLAAFKLDAENGRLAAQYSGEHFGSSFSAAALHRPSAKLAAAWNSASSGSGVVVLDSGLNPVVEETVDFHARGGAAWASEETVWVAGWRKGSRKFVNHPVVACLDASGKGSLAQASWDDARVIDQTDLVVVDGLCVLAAAENLSEHDDIVNNSRITLRRCEGDPEPLFTYQRGEVYHGSPRLAAFDGGFLLGIDHGSEGPILVLFHTGK